METTTTTPSPPEASASPSPASTLARLARQALASGPVADCGHAFNPPGPAGGAAGYATSRGPPEVSVCYPCAEAGEREEMARSHATGGRWFSYLAADGSTLGNWTGSPLAVVVACTPSGNLWADRLGSQMGRLYRLRAIDGKGRLWVGTGFKGAYARLRAAKTSPSPDDLDRLARTAHRGA